MRNIGMNVVNNFPPVKNLIKEAAERHPLAP
jgi:hypothetical protein